MINKSTENLIPRVVFTDSDPAISNAISIEFSGSVHCLRIFHIDLNLKKNLRNKLTTNEFRDANSTQRIESLNKKVHDSVNSGASLLTLVKEIQQLLDNEAKYVKAQEYKEEIPSVGL
ncbi:hypothetical protein Glove_34g128 [Diversispora epigaea]|uniref:MULE transposase domain-containing protein n=1 Tax=Diversispora epigaea TaxID=1348612 RepID=A0A397JL13_9GLOM|nr:hypothetical protein Glove_34g128 [Diversispora epigaea]